MTRKAPALQPGAQKETPTAEAAGVVRGAPEWTPAPVTAGERIAPAVTGSGFRVEVSVGRVRILDPDPEPRVASRDK